MENDTTTETDVKVTSDSENIYNVDETDWEELYGTVRFNIPTFSVPSFQFT